MRDVPNPQKPWVFLCGDTLRNAGIRHRAWLFARALETAGESCRVCFPAEPEERIRLWEQGNRFDKAVYLARCWLRLLLALRHVPGARAVFIRGRMFPYGPPLLEWLAGLLNPRIMFDVDDAVWEPPAFVSSPFVRFQDRKWAARMCRISRVAIAGNRLIAAYLRDHGGRGVRVIPTCVDMERFPVRERPTKKPGEPIIVGWIGSRDNLGYLRSVGDALARTAQRYPIRLLAVSNGHFEWPGLEVENRPWSLEREPDDLHEMDIGIMPLDDTPRARGKCAFKALLCMAAGMPVILSPVGMNREVVEHGQSGFLAATPEEWERYLEMLCGDAELRAEMGRRARDRIERDYSIHAHLPRFHEALRETAGELPVKEEWDGLASPAQ